MGLAGIYCIENSITGAKYVGQGLNVKTRMFAKHFECVILNNAIKKYGRENFKRHIILYCEPNKSELAYYETACIKIFHSHVSENGYNIAWGGISPMTGRHHSKKTKDRLSKIFKGSHISEKTKKLIRKNNAKFWQGKNRSKESIEKMKAAIRPTGKDSASYGKKRKNPSSQYYGVSKYTKAIKQKTYTYWYATIRENGKAKHIKCCKIELDAAKAYDRYVIENKLDRPLNFSKQEKGK